MIKIISFLTLFGLLIINNASGTWLQNGVQVYGVHTTYHGAYEAGACELPKASYAIGYPIALGNIESLKHLKWRPELCGQVLQIDCGNGPLDVVVINSNLGNGLDLYASTWNKLTNYMSPGVKYCNVKLRFGNAFNFNGPRCYHRHDTSNDNAYYRNVALLNTNGRLVTRATVNNHDGVHHGDNPFFAFSFGAKISLDEQVVFTFEDGGTHTVHLRDCEYQNEKQFWS